MSLKEKFKSQLDPMRDRVRTNIKDRGRFYVSMVSNGIMSRDEVRELEDLDPIPGGAGDEFLVPLNMGVAGDVAEDEIDKEEETEDEDIERGLYGPECLRANIYTKWPELINWAIKHLPPMLAVPGQHDLPYHDYKELGRSAYATK